MPRHCSICTHPDRASIDAALVAGEAYRNIVERFGTALASLVRHKTDHIPAHLAKAEEAKTVTQADSLLACLLLLSRETAAILKEARSKDTKDNELALKAIARAEKQIELQARLLGELQESTTVNLVMLPEWQTLRATILNALAPFPQARIAVAEALQEVHHNGHSG